MNEKKATTEGIEQPTRENSETFENKKSSYTPIY